MIIDQMAPERGWSMKKASPKNKNKGKKVETRNSVRDSVNSIAKDFSTLKSTSRLSMK